MLWATSSEVPVLIPAYKYQQTLVSSTSLDEKNYLAFPILLRLGPSDVLVAFKRGGAHARDGDAVFEAVHFDPAKQRLVGSAIDFREPGLVMQDGEFARFPNGDIAGYFDVQSPAVIRQGLVQYRSTDGGRTFRNLRKVGVIDGVEYGYAFEAITSGSTTWMLVMTFRSLPGGAESVESIKDLPAHAGSVDAIRTDDNGKSWRRVRNLSRAFGNLPINESSFVRYGDGFIVTTRGYNNHEWLTLTDHEFVAKKQVDLTNKYPFVRSMIGRPRVFEKEGRFYLLGRNWTAPMTARTDGNKQMKLSLFRFDPETLAINRHVVLDNAEEEFVRDGYYAVPYWQDRGGREFLNIITYKAVRDRFPDIVRFEFDWDEVK